MPNDNVPSTIVAIASHYLRTTGYEVLDDKYTSHIVARKDEVTMFAEVVDEIFMWRTIPADVPRMEKFKQKYCRKHGNIDGETRYDIIQVFIALDRGHIKHTIGDYERIRHGLRVQDDILD